jgi:hypothetical protein
MKNILPKPITVSSKKLAKNTNLLYDLFRDIENQEIKKYEVFDTTEDLLVLSCVWSRIRNLPIRKAGTVLLKNTIGGIILSNPINSITDKSLFENITEEDRILARKIRDYYSKKIMMLKLKQKTLTKYREDLNVFVHSDGKKFTQEVIGMVYRLPEFYENDILLDKIFADKVKIVKKCHSSRQTKVLTYIDTSVINNSRSKSLDYWFVDEDNQVVNINLAQDNPLVDIWEDIIREPIKLNAIFFTKNKDEYFYYRAEKYTVES